MDGLAPRVQRIVVQIENAGAAHADAMGKFRSRVDFLNDGGYTFQHDTLPTVNDLEIAGPFAKKELWRVICDVRQREKAYARRLANVPNLPEHIKELFMPDYMNYARREG